MSYFIKIVIIMVYLSKIQIIIYSYYYVNLVIYNLVLNEKIRLYTVYFLILNQKIYIILKIEHYIVQKVKKVSKFYDNNKLNYGTW